MDSRLANIKLIFLRWCRTWQPTFIILASRYLLLLLLSLHVLSSLFKEVSFALLIILLFFISYIGEHTRLRCKGKAKLNKYVFYCSKFSLLVFSFGYNECNQDASMSSEFKLVDYFIYLDNGVNDEYAGFDIFWPLCEILKLLMSILSQICSVFHLLSNYCTCFCCSSTCSIMHIKTKFVWIWCNRASGI